MSNDSPSPPPLRLKPRLSPAAKEASPTQPASMVSPLINDPAPSSPAPAAPAPPALVPAALAVTPAVPAPAAPTMIGGLSVAPSAPPPPVIAPAGAANVSPPPAPASVADDPGKFKLKPRALVAPPLVQSPVVEAPVPAPMPVPAIVKPVMPAAALASPAFAKPAVPAAAPGRPNIPISPLPPGASAPLGRPTEKSSDTAVPAKAGLGVIISLIVVALGVFGYIGYKLLRSDAPLAAPAPAQPATPPEPAVKPGSLVVESPQSTAGKLVAKAEAAVAAHNNAHTEATTEVLGDPAAPSIEAAAPAIEIAPAVVAPPAVPVVVPPPEPSPAFRAYVVNLKVSGVFQGESARAMFNGKLYRLGEVVDSKLGIVFARIDPETKHLIFEDSKGAVMMRRY